MTTEKLIRHMNEHNIPYYMQSSVINWVFDGILPGDFLTGVLQNDLKKALNHADNTNINLLPNYVRVLYNYAPIACWGSKENVERWKGLYI